MIYVASDLHGCDPAVFFRLLEQAGFGEEDTLYILGDVIDRGVHGVALLRWILEQSNVKMLLGNHESILLSLEFLFDDTGREDPVWLNRRQQILLDNWIYNGGTPTLRGLKQIQKEDPQLLRGILKYLRELPLYECLTVKEKKYVLVHAGLGNFGPEKPLSDYTLQELVWERPSLQTRYYEDATVIFGHTPTIYYGQEYAGRAIRTESWICIDAGAAGGKPPMLLRLEDEKEFYLT